MILVSVYDKKAQTFSQPFCAINEQVAIRQFGDAVRDTNTAICAHPEDYQLFNVGVFDESHGVCIPADRCTDGLHLAPVHLIDAISLVPPVQA
ncbi:Uncharacterised protein [Chlamydia trachomatis]|jgi:hypothetical protein|nr:Uncharacterised protein [Chlamydia trachomatis]